MYLSNLALAAFTLLGATQAFKSISISQNVTAGQNTTVTIINDENDAKAVNYTVSLYTAVQNFPICTLSSSSLSKPTTDDPQARSSPPSPSPRPNSPSLYLPPSGPQASTIVSISSPSPPATSRSSPRPHTQISSSSPTPPACSPPMKSPQTSSSEISSTTPCRSPANHTIVRANAYALIPRFTTLLVD
jgi:hypothetical protein